MSNGVLEFLVISSPATGERKIGGVDGWMFLGETLVGRGTLTGALRQYNLPTARAPGDWPEPTVNGTVRF